MNNNIKLTTWVYYLYRSPHVAPKSNRNNPVMMASIPNDLIPHPCQITMKKISRSKLPKNIRENLRKDRGKHLHIIWREKVNINLNKILSQIKILPKMMIHLNLKVHNFNITRMGRDKVLRLHWQWLGYFWWFAKKNTFTKFLEFSYTLSYLFLYFHMYLIRIERKDNFTKPFILPSKSPYQKISMGCFHHFSVPKMISWITHGFYSLIIVTC